MSRFLIATAGLLLATVANASDAEPFVICYEDEHFPPYIMGPAQHHPRKGGIVYDYIVQSAERLGHPVVFERKPWKRCQVELQYGEVDAMFATIHTEERDAWAVFPKTQGELDNRYLHKATYPVFVSDATELSWDGQGFTPSSAVVQSVPGYISEKMLLAMGMQPVTALQPREALPLIASGRLDGYVLEDMIGHTLAKELGLSETVTVLPEPFLQQPWYLAFSKQRYAEDPGLIESFWTMLKDVRETQGPEIRRLYSE